MVRFHKHRCKAVARMAAAAAAAAARLEVFPQRCCIFPSRWSMLLLLKLHLYYWCGYPLELPKSCCSCTSGFRCSSFLTLCYCSSLEPCLRPRRCYFQGSCCCFHGCGSCFGCWICYDFCCALAAVLLVALFLLLLPLSCYNDLAATGAVVMTASSWYCDY